MRTLAVLPVKSYARAKQRLSATVGDRERPVLAAAMVADVLEALAAVRRLNGVLVVTSEPRVAASACALGASLVADGSATGQSAAAQLGIAAALRAGAERVLCVPGDCPAMAPPELEELLAGDAEPEVAIVPDRHGSGTNALLLAPPGVIRPAFGPGSRARHEALAAAAGVRARVVELPSLALDVDTGDDLAALEATLAATPGIAPRTRSALLALAA